MRSILKSNNDFWGKLKTGDFIIVLTVIAVSVFLFILPFFAGEKLVAEISLDGELHSYIELSTLSEKKTVEVGGCEILVEKDGVTFITSSCPDKLCVNRGKMKKAGDTMACVPERVTVVLKGGEKDGFDAVVF